MAGIGGEGRRSDQRRWKVAADSISLCAGMEGAARLPDMEEVVLRQPQGGREGRDLLAPPACAHPCSRIRGLILLEQNKARPHPFKIRGEMIRLERKKEKKTDVG